jgi:hypothetical protein
MLPLNASALVILTGNGLTVSEDLSRRFIAVELDPRTEDPEARPFRNDIRAEVTTKRVELLAAALTIWRWGRQTAEIPAGSRLGSFEQWGLWVRDPLLALCCQDPVKRIGEAKQRDGRRQVLSDWFALWRDQHGDRPVTVSKLHDDVKLAIDPQGRGRQYVATHLEKHTGTRVGGFVLERQAAVGKWGAATYAIKSSSTNEEDRGHRVHRDQAQVSMVAGRRADAPYAPNANEVLSSTAANTTTPAGSETLAAVDPTPKSSADPGEPQISETTP